LSDELKTCPRCESPNGYYLKPEVYACPECGNEWNPENLIDEGTLIVKDAYGNTLQNGDAVLIVKDLPVKGSSSPLKAGTKIKNIRLTEGDHNIDCKIDGFGAMALKSEFVKKA
jgi:protein PhnA